MAVRQKLSGRAASMPGGLTAGAVASLSVTILMAALLAMLVESERVQENAIGYGVMVTLVLASFTGAMIAAAKIKRQRLLVCILSAGIYFGMLLATTALFFGGQYSAVGVTALMVLCGGILAILAGLHRDRGGKHPKRRHPSR